MAKPKPNYYAVAKGRRPGIYTDWPDCSTQVTGFPGSKFKGHATLEQAKEWMRDYNAEQYAAVIEEPHSISGNSTPRSEPKVSTPTATRAHALAGTISPSLPFSLTWKPFGELSPEVKFQFTQEITASQGHDVKPQAVKQEYERQRTRAMHDALEMRFFVGAASKLEGYRALCRAVRIEPSNTILECRDDLRGTLVNIVDLLDAAHFDKPVKVWRHEEWRAFVAYTKDPKHCFYVNEAKKSEYLQCFLQKLFLEEPRRYGNPRPLQTVIEPALPKTEPTSPMSSAKIKEEDQFEGIGRLSPLASECIYDDDDSTVLDVTRRRKRGSQHMEPGEVEEEIETKRPRLASQRRPRVSQAITLANEAKSLYDLEDTIPSGQCQDPDGVDH